MKKVLVVLAVILGILGIAGFLTFRTYTSLYDRNVHLTSEFKAAKGAVQTDFNTMVKTLKDQTNLNEMQNDKAIEYAKVLMEGNYTKNDGSLMKWINIQFPNMEQKNYNILMDNIESLRKGFQDKQDRVLAIIEQHDNLRNEFWSSMFLGKIPELEYTIISSKKAKEVMITGDDDTDMFEDVKK